MDHKRCEDDDPSPSAIRNDCSGHSTFCISTARHFSILFHSDIEIIAAAIRINIEKKKINK